MEKSNIKKNIKKISGFNKKAKKKKLKKAKFINYYIQILKGLNDPFPSIVTLNL